MIDHEFIVQVLESTMLLEMEPAVVAERVKIQRRYHELIDKSNSFRQANVQARAEWLKTYLEANHEQLPAADRPSRGRGRPKG